MPIGGTRHLCRLHIPSQLRSLWAANHNTKRPPHLRQYLQSSALLRSSSLRNNPSRRWESGIDFGKDRIANLLVPMEAKEQGRILRGHEREFLPVLPYIPHLSCECTQHTVIIFSLFPANSCHTFCKWP